MPKLETNAEAYPRLLDWLRYFCAFMLYMYGISKLVHLQFNMQSELAQQPVGSLTGYQLTWFYFGFSLVYASILGLTQVVGATCCFSEKPRSSGRSQCFRLWPTFCSSIYSSWSTTTDRTSSRGSFAHRC